MNQLMPGVSNYEPSVKDTMLALADLYRDMAAQIEQLDILRSSLRHPS